MTVAAASAVKDMEVAIQSQHLNIQSYFYPSFTTREVYGVID